MKIDMSPHAVTMRLRQASELRRLCIALGGDRNKKQIRDLISQENSNKSDELMQNLEE